MGLHPPPKHTESPSRKGRGDKEGTRRKVDTACRPFGVSS